MSPSGTPAQLPLDIRLRPAATFVEFVPGQNGEALACLRDGLSGTDSVFLWGGAGAGKTHLLQAVCHLAAGRGERPCYLPLARAAEMAPAVLEGLEALAVVCVDDLQAIAGEPAWERGLFSLYEALRAAGGRLVAAADRAPRALGLALPDLATRLAWGPVFQLQPLGDEALMDALRRRADAFGIELPGEVARWLVQRCVRDATALFELLEGLERESLSARRRLTVPFVREVLERRARNPRAP